MLLLMYSFTKPNAMNIMPLQLLHYKDSLSLHLEWNTRGMCCLILILVGYAKRYVAQVHRERWHYHPSKTFWETHWTFN